MVEGVRNAAAVALDTSNPAGKGLLVSVAAIVVMNLIGVDTDLSRFAEGEGTSESRIEELEAEILDYRETKVHEIDDRLLRLEIAVKALEGNGGIIE